MEDFPGPAVEDTRPAFSNQKLHSWRTGRLLPYGVMLALSAALLIYAVTRSFVWDEGFHLIAAQRILAGKKPYIDFCFPQTPLNAYWNAVWMAIGGENWRVTHVAATIWVIGALLLLADYLLRRFPDPRWRTVSAISALLLLALQPEVVEFGTIAQAYAICLFMGFAAFRLSIEAVEREGVRLPLLAGLCAGAAAASSLLSAPVACVLSIWMFLENRHGNRLGKTAAFLAGAAAPFLPVLWLFAQAPHEVFFNIVQYQTLYRRVDWAGATVHDVDVLTSWIDSGPVLLLAVLAIAGLFYARRNRTAEPRISRDLVLCAWISAALLAYISTAHPTFSRYYVIAIPFLSLLAAPGLYQLAARLAPSGRPLAVAGGVCAFLLIAIFRMIFNDRDSATWQIYEQIARKVADVTPQKARLFADEQVYFLLKRVPPPGMEFSYSHKLQLPASEEARLHIISEKELLQEVKAGQFPTLETCNDDRIDDWNLAKLYRRRADISDCAVFWDFQGPVSEPARK